MRTWERRTCIAVADTVAVVVVVGCWCWSSYCPPGDLMMVCGEYVRVVLDLVVCNYLISTIRGREGGGGGVPCISCLRRVIIDHASFSRLSSMEV